MAARSYTLSVRQPGFEAHFVFGQWTGHRGRPPNDLLGAPYSYRLDPATPWRRSPKFTCAACPHDGQVIPLSGGWVYQAWDRRAAPIADRAVHSPSSAKSLEAVRRRASPTLV